MAVDTPTKRASALNVRTRCRRFLPVPDGTIAVADRAHLAGVYYEAITTTEPVFGWIARTADRFSVANPAIRLAICATQQRVWIARADNE